MDPPEKPNPQKGYDIDARPEAALYTGAQSAMGVPIQGIPLYPEHTPEDPNIGRFVVQGCQDLWMALIFIGTVFMIVVWGSVNLSTNHLSDNFSDSSSNPFSDMVLILDHSATLIILFTVFAISVFSSVSVLSLIRCFPKQLIYIANILSVVVTFSMSVVAFVKGIIFMGVCLLILALLHALWFFFVTDRIPLSAELLKASTNVLSRYKSIFFLNVLLSVICGIYTFFWGFTVAPTITRIEKSENGVGDAFLLILFMLCFFWTVQVIPNLMHVTTAGVTATWYFAGENHMPPNPTFHSFKRATTTSFGSVCFGSLIVAFVRLLRWLAQTAGEHENEFIRCITVCILQCLENLIEYFNTYAFVHVAVYGCSYIEAAKRTWALCKECGFAAYFNDALVSTTLNLITFVISLALGLAVGLIMYSVAYGSLAFVLACVVHALFFTAVESAVTTLFVCFAEVPEALQHSAPDLVVALQVADQNGNQHNAMRP